MPTFTGTRSATSAAASTRASPAPSRRRRAHATLVDSRSRRRPEGHRQGHRDRGHTARVARRRSTGSRSTSCCACPCSSICGSPQDALRELRRVPRPGASCLVNVPTWRGKRCLEFVRVPARPQPGRGDGRPQELLRSARPLAAAGRGGVPARATSAATGTSSASTPSPSAASPSRDMSTSPRRTWTRPARIVGSARRGRGRPSRRRLWPQSATAAGGSSSSASAARPATRRHAVNDFRKICGFEAYAPTDNVSELTARMNDEGWDTIFATWLEGSRLGERDAVLVFSVGGGSVESEASPSTSCARIELAKRAGATVFGIVGRDGGYTARGRGRVRRRSRRCHATDHAAHRGPLRGGLAPAGQPSRARSVSTTEVGVASLSDGTAGPRSVAASSAAPASSAATSSTACSPTRRSLRVTVYDNFSSGREWHLDASQRRSAPARRARRCRRPRALSTARADGHDVVDPPRVQPRHRARGDRADASTSTRARCSPTTSSRRCATDLRRASSSTRRAAASTATSARSRRTRTTGRCCRSSTYGASKLAGEALISAYCSMFGSPGRAFRFGNVVGPRQTHGVGLRLRRGAARRPDAPRASSATARRASPTSTSTTSSARC